MSDRRVAGYSFASRSFHWLTALLVLAAYILSIGGPEARVFADGNKGLLTLHESLGLAIFVTTLLRLAHRRWARPPDRVSMPVWIHQAALATRLLLYFLLVFLPLGHRRQLDRRALAKLLFGRLNCIALGDISGAWTVNIELHKLAGDAIMWLAGVHATAALFHHFILKDNVLRSMLVSS
jgi:cytochrome b561